MFRIAAYITHLSPAFELHGNDFNWGAYWTGGYTIFLDELGHVPAHAPNVREPKSSSDVVGGLRSLAQLQLRREFMRDYHQDLLARFNTPSIVEGLITQRRTATELGAYHGRTFPEYNRAKQDAISPKQYLHAARALCVSQQDLWSLTIFINKPFIRSWISAFEQSRKYGKQLEFGTRFRICGGDNTELQHNIERFLSGKVTVGSPGYSFRGFSMPLPPSD